MALSWLERFAASIADRASDAVKNDVMKGAETLGSRPTPSQRARWVKGAMERLAALVDEETQIQIMVHICPHKYPKKRIEKLREQYKQLGNIDKLLEIMCNDTSYGGTSYYDYPQRKGNTVYITKVPCNPKSHQKAEAGLDRKLAYCHCSWTRAALRTREPVSPTFCYCSVSWDKQLWEGILGKPVDVKVVKSLLNGDDTCVHAFPLPQDVLERHR
jgi:hypothetical protein